MHTHRVPGDLFTLHLRKLKKEDLFVEETGEVSRIWPCERRRGGLKYPVIRKVYFEGGRPLHILMLQSGMD